MTSDVALLLPHELRGARAAVATKHEKTATIARALGGPTGFRIQTTAVDTDTLGTFTGEIPRTGTPRQTATVKAQWACRDSGLDIGIGSEGSFFPHPDVAFITIQIEHVALTQMSTGLVVIGTAIGAAPWTMRRTVTSELHLNGLCDLLAAGAQRFIVRPDPCSVGGAGISKGIATADHLRAAVTDAISHSETGRAIVETDLRAHTIPGSDRADPGTCSDCNP